MHDAVSMSLRRGDGLYLVDAELLMKLQPDVIVTQGLFHLATAGFTATRITARLLNMSS